MSSQAFSGRTRFTYRVTVSLSTSESLTGVYFSLCSPIVENTTPFNQDGSWVLLSSAQTPSTLDETGWSGYRRDVSAAAGQVVDSSFNVTGQFVLSPISVILRFGSSDYIVATVLGPVVSTCAGVYPF